MSRFCTAVTAQNLPWTRLLVRDLHRVAPGADVAVLDADGIRPVVPGAIIVAPESLAATPEEMHRLTLSLEPDRLQQLLVARLLANLLADHSRECDVVTWVSPTSLVLDSLTDLDDAAAAAGLAVLPRAPRAAGPPRPSELLAAGVWSDALFAIRSDAVRILEEVAEAVTEDLPAASLPLLDVLVARTSHRVVTDDGLAVSAASVGPDTFGGDADHPTLRGRPVRHLDLAGFDPRRPWLVDASAASPRVLLSRDPVLAALLARVADRLLAEEVSAGPAVAPHGTARLADGTAVDPQLRRLVRRALASDTPPPDLLAVPAHEVRGWLLAPVTPPPWPLTRYLQAVYLDRPDLQDAFPGVPEHNAEAFLGWASAHGRSEPDYDASLLMESVRIAHASPALMPVAGDPVCAPQGLNIVGYLRGELGVGESARLVVAAARAAGVPHRTVSVSRHLQSREGASFTPTEGAGVPFDATLLCVNADMVGEISPVVPELVTGRHRIGMWYWEVEHFPESLAPAFAHVDEVWAATDFVRDAVAARTDKPVLTMPPPLPRPARTTDLTRADLDLPEDVPIFLFSFDFLSTVERKNPYGLIEAFRRAFAPGEGPVLVLKTINADRRLPEAERLRLRVAREPDMHLMERYLDASERDALTLLCDAYVSLHRAEGLGLTVAEAMALGKPVVATAYSGNLQFMTTENSFLVPHRLVPIPEGCDPYPAGTPWADPDLAAAAQAMRTIVDDPDVAAARGHRAALDIAELHSPEVAGARIARRLDEIRAARTGTGAPGAARRTLTSLLRRR